MREASNHSMGPDCLLGWRRQRLASGVAGVGSRSIHSKLAGDKLGILGRREERGRHVTLSPVFPAAILRYSLRTEPPYHFKKNFARPPAQLEFQSNSMMRFAVRRQSACFRWAHPPVAEALRADTRLLCGIRRENGLE